MNICGTLWLVAHLWSYHGQEGIPYNNENYGLGIHCDVTEKVTVSTGYFENSFDRGSFYLVGGYSFNFYNGFNIRPFGGIASGYGPEGYSLGNAIAPFVAGLEFYYETDHTQIGVTVTPDHGYTGKLLINNEVVEFNNEGFYPVFHLTASFSFGSNH